MDNPSLNISQLVSSAILRSFDKITKPFVHHPDIPKTKFRAQNRNPITDNVKQRS